jgi:hypothetical protein
LSTTFTVYAALELLVVDTDVELVVEVVLVGGVVVALGPLGLVASYATTAAITTMTSTTTAAMVVDSALRSGPLEHVRVCKRMDGSGSRSHLRDCIAACSARVVPSIRAGRCYRPSTILIKDRSPIFPS